MGIKNIEKHSAAFNVLKCWVKCWHNFVFYRKVDYINRELVPLQEHLIFTPNHQNALMDSLAIELSFSNQFVFLSRSDIFKNKIIASILYFLKLLPVYRIRDGYESLKKNKQIFDKTMDIIHNKNGFVIFPEGNHVGKRHLRVLKKGFARIAFQAEEAADYQLDIKIIPVGINYNNYENYRSDLLVIFGEPLHVSEFYESHKVNPAVAYNLIKEKLAERIKPLIIEIDSPYYDLYNGLRSVFGKQACVLLSLDPNLQIERFRAEKIMIDLLKRIETTHPETIPAIEAQLNSYLTLLDTMKFSHEEMCRQPLSKSLFGLYVLGLLVGSPLFLYGYINHFIPYYIPIHIANKIKDPQFRSSFKFVLNMVLFPLAYLFQAAIVHLIYPHPWFVLGYLISLPLTAPIAWNYPKLFRKTRKQFHFLKHQNGKTEEFISAEMLWKEIKIKMESIFSTYLKQPANQKETIA